MPEENKIKKEDPKVDIDTSGPEVDVTLPEEKKEEAIQAEETIKEVVKEEVKEEPTESTESTESTEPTAKEADTQLEDYSKGVQSRIAKLTRKMREAERREAAATEYAQAVEYQRTSDQKKYLKIESLEQ